MRATTDAAEPPTSPDPNPDRPATGTPARTARLRNLVRALIAYGRQLAETLQQRTAATDLAQVTRHFGSLDIAAILARITRGLQRATELDARLANPLAIRPGHPPAAPAARDSQGRQPPPGQPAPGNPDAPGPPPVRLPTPRAIAAAIRQRPIGVVIADICRDLGIVPSHPLWHEISLAIISYGGSLAALVKDICQRPVWPCQPPGPAYPATPPGLPRLAAAPATGPP